MAPLRILLSAAALALAQDVFLSKTPQPQAAKGGIPCIACGLILAMTYENAGVRDKFEHAMRAKCKGVVDCDLAVDLLMKFVDVRASPDAICNDIGLCENSCQLFPDGEWPAPIPTLQPNDPKNRARRLSTVTRMFSPEQAGHLRKPFVAPEQNLGAERFSSLSGVSAAFSAARHLLGVTVSPEEALLEVARRAAPSLEHSHPCAGNVTSRVKCIIDRFADEHLPIFDADADAFGPRFARGLRGSHWRGADCDDRHSTVYPGRQISNFDASKDHDCNGISGSNASGSFEEVLCSAVPRRGLIHLGDSATAHFHLPNQWLTTNHSVWNLDNVLTDAADELDQPACAWGTGFHAANHCPFAARRGQPQRLSIAARLRQRNLCNHRDFQNIGVNGARVTNAHGLVESMARNSTLDHPALVIFSLIGNDVCNGHEWTSHMTPPAEFKRNVLDHLAALDVKLPKGSAVLMVGLVDGRVLYDTMHDVQHPIGAKTKDVYEYLNCNDETPCKGWLNSNETFRNVTSEWAFSLNAQYEAIIDDGHSFKNFELGYFDPDWRSIIADWVSAGGRAEDLIERVDGFHPAQLGNELLSDAVWRHLETKFPSAIGDVNPHNDEIEALFGDQGGF